MQAIPLSLYIHFPWCIQKCPYCDFNSHHYPKQINQLEYVEALIRELECFLPYVWGRRINSIFIGGGTPSLFDPFALEKLFSELRARLNYAPYIEITMEANPGTVDSEHFATFADLGVNRLSLGIQSFDPQKLKKLGRIHDEKQAHQAIEIALRHFHNVNIDLMFGLPEQSIEEAISDINQALSYPVQHLSHYQLTLEPNTFFHRYPPQLPLDDDIALMQEAVYQQLKNSGFKRYEVSAFALVEAEKDWRCQHNLNYWQFGDYLGIGAGSHGKLTLMAKHEILRTSAHKQPRGYMERAGRLDKLERFSPVAIEELPFEFMLNVLRLTEGVPLSFYTERTFLPIETIQASLEKLYAQGWLVQDSQQLVTTPQGMQFLNQVLQVFL